MPPGVSVHRDVVHTKVPGYRSLSLDLYVPQVPARALCVYVHGGGWRTGSRREGPGPLSSTSSRLFGRMALQGLALASVDYRLSGEAPFPAQVDDVRAACRWLVGDEASPGRGLPLVFFGVSAGGQIAALCGLDPEVRASAVALWYPVTDLLAMPDDIAVAGGTPDRSPDSREALLLGAPAAAVPELAREASPVAHVQAGAPPFLLVHGDEDLLVPARQSERLHSALSAKGVSSRIVMIAGQTHMLPGIAPAKLEELVDLTTAFLLDQVLSRTAKAP